MVDVIIVVLVIAVSIAYSYAKAKVAEKQIDDIPEMPTAEPPAFDDYPPYFSYETEEVPQPKKVKQKTPKNDVNNAYTESVAVQSVESEPYCFDLRQAVIAETVLHNKFIDERF